MTEQREKFSPFLSMIISGGQTGVDRAALDTALAFGLHIGGWSPKNRKAEDGSVPLRYPMLETDSDKYPPRTAKNIKDSDATLIFKTNNSSKGTVLTETICLQLGKDHFISETGLSANQKLSDKKAQLLADEITSWLLQVRPSILNVAGSRESACRGIAKNTEKVLEQVFKNLKNYIVSDKPVWPPAKKKEPSLFDFLREDDQYILLKARNEDLDAIMSFDELTFKTVTDHFPRRNYKHLINSPTSRFYLLKDSDNEIKGLIIGLLRNFKIPSGRIYKIAVHPDLKGLGKGGELLEFMEDVFRKEKMLKSFAEVRESNMPSRRMFEKKGYELIKPLPIYYGNLEKKLELEDGVKYMKLL